MKIIQMKVNHLTRPLGYMMKSPVFSYKIIESKGIKQTSARIKVALDESMTDLVYDSGESTDIDSIAHVVPINLKPRTRYYWTLKVRSDAGEVIESDVEWFETGKLSEEWSAKWICSELNDGNHPYFYKNFSLKGKVKKARLYISGLGLYEAYINEEKISEEYLTPYSNDYHQWIQYQTYDVTEMMNQKNIQLGVLMGNGWYKGRFGFRSKIEDKGFYGDKFILISELFIEYEDGSIETIESDDSWKARKSKIQYSSIYDGEVYDETFSEDCTYPVKIHDKDIAKLTERLSLPVKVKEERKPVKLITSPRGETILDIGQNHTGWFRLNIREKSGAHLKLYFGEELQDGCFYNENLRTAKAEYTYISDGSPKTIRPHFTFYGYRYVKLEGFSNFKADDYTALILYSDLDMTGNMHTGHELVNKLISNTLWGQISNFLDVPTDCPQRDERMGWTGDAQVFTPTACFTMDSYAFYKKYLYDLYEEQKELNGAVPYVVPSCGINDTCSVWGDAATIMPFMLYQFYGDRQILEDQYLSMKAWVDYIYNYNGEDWKWREKFHFGDWLALDAKPGTNVGRTDVGYIASVYYYHSTLLVSKTAGILEKKEEEIFYGNRADDILKEIQAEYFSINGRACINTQTSYVLALKYGLTTNKKRTITDLYQALRDNDGKLCTGFVGTPLLCNVLSENEMNDMAYALLVNEEYPGWLYSVKLGATTIWERWNSLDESGHFSSTGMNSLNHYAYGSIVEWLYRHVAGLTPMLSKPGFREIQLKPKPDTRLGKAKACFDSPVGVYESSWEIKENDSIVFDFVIPFGGKAYLTLPNAPEELYNQKDNSAFFNVLKTDEGYQCILKNGTYHIEYMPTTFFRKVYSIDTSINEIYQNKVAKEILSEELPALSQLPDSRRQYSIAELLETSQYRMLHDKSEKLDRRLRSIR